MTKHILLIAGLSQGSWLDMVRCAAERHGAILTVVDPTHIEQSLDNQWFTNPGFDPVLIDSATVPDVANLIGALGSAAAKETVVLTAVQDWQEARNLLRAGAANYESKPYNTVDINKYFQSMVIPTPDSVDEEVSDGRNTSTCR